RLLGEMPSKFLYTAKPPPQSILVSGLSSARRSLGKVASSSALNMVNFDHDLGAAITRSQSYLLTEQKPEGYWVGELMVDSTLVSDTIAYHHWNGKVDPVWQKKAVNHIFSMQLRDGGWNIYHGGPAEVNATINAYLALKLAGIAVTDPRM